MTCFVFFEASVSWIFSGVHSPPSFEGRSLLGRLAGRGAADEAGDEPAARSEWYDPKLRKSLQTVRTARWRYVANPEELTPTCVPSGDYYAVAREELYDVAADPREQRNVIADHPDVARTLAERTQEGGAAADAAPLPVDPNLKEELKALGYLE